MPLTLLLRLPAPGQQDCEWLTVDTSGLPAGGRQTGPLDAVAAAAAGCRVVLLAPATQVLLADPELPPGSGAKLARVIPFALEEQLTEDIDQLFFAVGRRTDRGTTSVAVVSREILQGWLTMLSQAGIEVAAIYADAALIPENPGQTVLWLEANRLAIRRPGAEPVTVEMEPVSEALAVTGLIDGALANGEPRAPESVLLYATAADWERVQHEFERLHDRFASLNVQLLPDGPLPWFARGLAASHAVNLLQGEFALATDYGSHWRAWRTPALLAAGLLFVHVAVQALQIRQANRQAATADAEIAQVFASAMPSEQLRDVRRQMQDRLDRIRKVGGGPQYFLRMTQALSVAAGGPQAINIEGLNFHEQTLDMKVSAANVESLSLLTKAVAQQGFTADIQSSAPAGQRIEAHLQVHAPRQSSK